MRSNIFDKVSFWSLFLVVVLLPIFFLPFTNIPVETAKGFLLVLGLSISIFFWAMARFSDGKITLPKSLCLLSGAGVVLAFFLSALFSKASQVSFFGTMFDVGTFWFIFIGFILMLYSSIIFREPKSARIVLLGTILSSIIVLIFQIFRFFLPEALSLGVLVGKTGNIFGSWNALGIFAGFSTLTSLLVMEFFPIANTVKWVLKILIVLGMVLVAAVNFSFVWILLGISSLIIFVYKVSITSYKVKEEGEKSNFPTFSFILVIVSLLFIISGGFVGGILPGRLGLSNNEVSPSFGATMSVTKSVLAKSPIFGVGPNRFGEAWAMYKPAVINTTAFWDAPFNFGSGLLPTFASTTGYLGILAWLVFFVLFIITGVKSIFSSIKNGANWEMMAFFVLSLYLFISSFFYSPGPVIFLLALSFAGVFVGLSVQSHQKQEISLLFLNDHRKSFFSILILVLLMIASVAISFKYTERMISVSYFRRALTASTISSAESSINKALALYSNDLYLRTYAQIYLIKLNSIVQKGSSLSDLDKVDLQESFDKAIQGAQLAVTYNPNSYLNFQALGSVYQAVGPLGIKDAYSKSIEAYAVASTLNPLNPGLKLAIANASFFDGKVKEAKDYADQALALKSDYIDALIMLSQIAKSEGNNASAISYAETALSFAPTNKDLAQYLSSLKNPSSSTSGATGVSTDKSVQEKKP